jgi:hypothetical protein
MVALASVISSLEDDTGPQLGHRADAPIKMPKSQNLTLKQNCLSAPSFSVQLNGSILSDSKLLGFAPENRCVRNWLL